MRRAGGVDQRLRWDTANVEARSAEPIGFDEDRVEAELAGADRGDIAAGASISARRRWMKVAAS